MGHNILMVGDDGRVFHVDSDDLGKVAKEVDKSSLSDDVKAHIDEKAGSQSGGSAYLFASRADLFVSSKADLFVASKADLFVSGDD